MNILFFVLVALVFVFIIYKTIQFNKKSDDDSNGDDLSNGGGGSTINTPYVTGEVPKDNIQ